MFVRVRVSGRNTKNHMDRIVVRSNARQSSVRQCTVHTIHVYRTESGRRAITTKNDMRIRNVSAMKFTLLLYTRISPIIYILYF